MDRALFYTLFAFIFFLRHAYSRYYPTVFWSPNNCKFKLNNETDEEYFFQVKPMSSMFFMCPHFALWLDKTDSRPHRNLAKENILVVDEDSYKTCSIKNGTQFKKLLTCDSDPLDMKVKYSEETFSSVNAHADKMCYSMGQHYYFISTSDGSIDSLNNTEGGHCKSHHMKLHIYVCNNTEPCDYNVAECPKEKEQINEKIVTTESPTDNCTNDLSVAAQTGVKVWFSDNRHPILYALMGLVIVILFVVIFWLVYVNRKYKKSAGIYADVKYEKKKTPFGKELNQC